MRFLLMLLCVVLFLTGCEGVRDNTAQTPPPIAPAPTPPAVLDAQKKVEQIAVVNSQLTATNASQAKSIDQLKAEIQAVQQREVAARELLQQSKDSEKLLKGQLVQAQKDKAAADAAAAEAKDKTVLSYFIAFLALATLACGACAWFIPAEKKDFVEAAAFSGLSALACLGIRQYYHDVVLAGAFLVVSIGIYLLYKLYKHTFSTVALKGLIHQGVVDAQAIFSNGAVSGFVKKVVSTLHTELQWALVKLHIEKPVPPPAPTPAAPVSPAPPKAT